MSTPEKVSNAAPASPATFDADAAHSSADMASATNYSAPGSLDYFERRGCYELARALLVDCLQQLVSDPQNQMPATQLERAWLMGRLDHCPVSCAQALSTLGMDFDGTLQSRFVNIALQDPAQALRMLSSPQVFRALYALTGPRGTGGNGGHAGHGQASQTLEPVHAESSDWPQEADEDASPARSMARQPMRPV
jgi:hypothetical protein